MGNLRIHTSESVSEGHPDKLADQISDALLDQFLEQDPTARVAIEAMLAHGVAVISGEVTTEGYVNVQKCVRETIKSVGYTNSDVGYDGDNCGVLVTIQEQSSDIAMGVDKGGAGDQGMMFGMACDETPELMPLPIHIAHRLTRQAVESRRSDPSLGFRPDAKAQVTVLYEGHRPLKVETVVLSQQHEPDVSQAEMKERIESAIVKPVLAEFAQFSSDEITYHFNPTGRFVKGGPAGDTGLTGRKIIVDTYGGMCPHGGGAFSGKDPTKVDRSAAYMARHVAKCIVAAGLARRVVVGLAYAIGKAEPVSVDVETFGTETVDPREIQRRVVEAFPLTPRGIIEHLGLLATRYLPTAKNGHFGNPAFPWERTQEAALLK
ncbi:MAG: methionine adenosyltransferase [Armatimonadetes bacterium]|nr:methionine adenosyltransferase [Armatimonadota bacterium]NOG38610.1 methionine adenosyltransferase [Armatimonadota bacterium]GIK31145.1 MAG: S-adenosylmethionine synthase [Armatimonadota bacterium]